MANEKRLIDANEPLKQLSDHMEKLHCSTDYIDGLYRGMEIAESYIKNAPTVDAAEVVHGRWIRRHNETKCSRCKFIYYSNHDDFNYCPNCGAKMDGDGNG